MRPFVSLPPAAMESFVNAGLGHLIIVLENDPRTATALTMFLTDRGYRAVHGRDVASVVTALDGRAGEVKAVLADYNLDHGLTGVEALTQLRALGVKAPALLLTGSLRRGAKHRQLTERYPVLEKPVRPERLDAWLRDFAGTEND